MSSGKAVLPLWPQLGWTGAAFGGAVSATRRFSNREPASPGREAAPGSRRDGKELRIEELEERAAGDLLLRP